MPSDTGYFWFFDAANMELLIKVLDGRAVNGKFWVMYGALSDVEYTITVVDTVTLATKTYYNAKGTLASAADIDAFADPERTASAEALTALPGRPVSVTEAMLLASPRTGLLLVEAAPEPVLEQLAACVPDATTLCLNSGRFRLTTSWSTASSGGGLGHAVPVTTDSGLFWFFYPGNIELAIKVLDGREVNGMFWVLYGALSDVHYTIRIDDTVTGASKLYDNPQGVLASKADILAFTP